ncbi:MAG: putative toxin-antitoxin system toxin component, PIN family [Deltaproteobacteria bacterium]|nr:putative toxin-antitoxin system toxin component, PIN family [Deltaproteobacteria bacterium]
MIRALLDSNVLISAAIRPDGPPGQTVSELLLHDSFELVLSPKIVAEVDIGLRLPKIRKYLPDPDEAIRWLADVVALADIVKDTGREKGASRDQGDDFILAAAIEGRAGTIVTGDEDLLSLEEHEGIAIVTPRAFLKLIAR